MQDICVIVPNWNGKNFLGECLDSLLAQSEPVRIVVVDNGSTDGSLELIKEFPSVHLVQLDRNYGFAGGVNRGIEYAIQNGARYIALLNNDAVADKNWLKELVRGIKKSNKTGIVTGKLVSRDNKYYDSTGDLYTTWGYPYPRGRDEPVSHKYDQEELVFAASGGASLYRVSMLEQIGLFDEDFFAYYEDVDLSFRAQLMGWKIRYVPGAIAYHGISQTSNKISGFTYRQTMKNLPWLFWKNVPARLMPVMLPRFTLMYAALLVGAIKKRQGLMATKGILLSLVYLPKKLTQRIGLQHRRQVSSNYIAGMLLWDLPPHTNKLHRLRNIWWRITGREIKHEA